MSLSASVMCKCFADGKTAEPPFSEHVWLDQEGYLALDLPSEDNWDKHSLFRQWLNTACEHRGMNLFSEYVSNWTRYRSFQQALATAGWKHFPTLRTELPETNDGLTSATAAARMLNELTFFITEAKLGWTTALVDLATGQQLYEHIKVYDGKFVCGITGIEMGVDENGFFICSSEGPARELFRSMDFQQNLLTGRLRKLFRRTLAEFVDMESGRKFRSREGLFRISRWPDGRMQDDNGKVNIEYPSRLRVIRRQSEPSEFEDILDPLRRACQAAVETGNSIRWR